MKLVLRKVAALRHRAHRWLSEEEAASAAEYAILASFVALAIVAAARALGGHLSDLFRLIGNAINH